MDSFYTIKAFHDRTIDLRLRLRKPRIHLVHRAAAPAAATHTTFEGNRSFQFAKTEKPKGSRRPRGPARPPAPWVRPIARHSSPNCDIVIKRVGSLLQPQHLRPSGASRRSHLRASWLRPPSELWRPRPQHRGLHPARPSRLPKFERRR